MDILSSHPPETRIYFEIELAADSPALIEDVRRLPVVHDATVVKSLNKTGELRRRLGDPSAAPAKSAARDIQLAAAAAGRASRRSTRAL